MNHKRLLIAAVAALALGALIGPHVIHAQDEDRDGIRDELRIMTQILEVSIGKDTIDRRVQQSVFDSRIRTEYIPTVGAIFTIPISFPLHPSEDEKGDASEEVVEVDLWEHFSNESENTSRVRADAVSPIPPVPPVDPLDTVDIEIDIEGLDKQVIRKYENAERNLFRQSLRELIYFPVNKRASGKYFLYVMEGEPYDPVKVSTLTHTIIQTIAQYGHRLKSLQNSERILVVLEAPGLRGPAKPVEVSTEYKGADEDLQSSALKNVKPWSEAILEREKRLRSGRLNAFNRPSDAGTAGFFFRSKQLYDLRSERPYERRLLAFKKSDLQQERSYDSIKGKVETTDY